MTRRLYFAYGSNMDEAQMAFRCPESELAGSATLTGYKFLINERGVASIVDEAGHSVTGLLWRISRADEKRLDSFEGVASGHYAKRVASVRQDDGTTADALMYVASSNKPGTPRPGYMEKIVQAARDHKHPAPSIEELKSWLLTSRQST